MIFKIKWGNLEPLLKKKHITESETKSPVFYFESEEEITVYKAGGYILCSSLSKDSIQDLVAFKQEYLADATELIEQPKEQTTLLIKTE